MVHRVRTRLEVSARKVRLVPLEHKDHREHLDQRGQRVRKDLPAQQVRRVHKVRVAVAVAVQDLKDQLVRQVHKASKVKLEQQVQPDQLVQRV